MPPGVDSFASQQTSGAIRRLERWRVGALTLDAQPPVAAPEQGVDLGASMIGPIPRLVGRLARPNLFENEPSGDQPSLVRYQG
jgi:hypothetical protein